MLLCKARWADTAIDVLETYTLGRHNDMKDLRCMSFTSKSNTEILVGGWQGTMFVIDVNKGEIVRQVRYSSGRTFGVAQELTGGDPGAYQQLLHDHEEKQVHLRCN